MRARGETTKQESLRLGGDHMGNYFVGLEAAWVRRDPRTVFDPWGIQPTLVVQHLEELTNKLQMPVNRS